MFTSRPFYPFLKNEEYVVVEGEVNCSSTDSVFDTNPFGWIDIKSNLPLEFFKKSNEPRILEKYFIKYSKMQHPNLPIKVARNITILDEAPMSSFPNKIILGDDLFD